MLAGPLSANAEYLFREISGPESSLDLASLMLLLPEAHRDCEGPNCIVSTST